MAEIDIDRNPVPGQPFVEVYPISTRLLTAGLWMSWSIGDDKVWPVEDDDNYGDAQGQRQVWCYYAAEHPDVPTNFEENPAPGAYYDDGFDTIQLFSEREEPPDDIQNQYLYAPTWIHYDLSGINTGGIQRAEFICNVGSNFEDTAEDDLPFIVQIRNGITDMDGWRPAPTDFQTITGPSICPVLSGAEIIANSSGLADHAYADLYAPPDYMEYGPRHVLPINAQGLAQLRRGGRQGITAGFDGSHIPQGYNFLYMECQYTTWDDEIAEGLPKLQAGVLLPKLRLWLGGAEAELTLGLRIEARPRIETPRRVLDHRARRLRDVG